MGLTLLCVTESKGSGSVDRRLFVSNEYSVHKDGDEKDWQHPDPRTLRYTEFGKLVSDERLSSMLHPLLYFGAETFGSHVRFIEDGAADIASGREQTWEQKTAQDKEYFQQLEAERHAEMMLEYQKQAPVYEFCARCRGQKESCKNPAHRGNLCMECCGGVWDRSNRYCSNCLDLPYREKREKSLGEAVVYSGEKQD